MRRAVGHIAALLALALAPSPARADEAVGRLAFAGDVESATNAVAAALDAKADAVKVVGAEVPAGMEDYWTVTESSVSYLPVGFVWTNAAANAWANGGPYDSPQQATAKSLTYDAARANPWRITASLAFAGGADAAELTLEGGAYALTLARAFGGGAVTNTVVYADALAGYDAATNRLARARAALENGDFSTLMGVAAALDAAKNELKENAR